MARKKTKSADDVAIDAAPPPAPPDPAAAATAVNALLYAGHLAAFDDTYGVGGHGAARNMPPDWPGRITADLAVQLVCPHAGCAAPLVRTGAVRTGLFWSCPMLHGRLIPQSVMIGRLAGVEFACLGDEERARALLASAGPRFEPRSGGRTPRRLLDDVARGQAAVVRAVVEGATQKATAEGAVRS